MGISVVSYQHLWLNLMQMSEKNKNRHMLMVKIVLSCHGFDNPQVQTPAEGVGCPAKPHAL